MATSTTTKKSNVFRHADKPAVVPLAGRVVSGEIPKWIEGNLYRNGPGILHIGPDTYNHWFDGLSLLHRFHIKDGKAEYQSRYLESDSYKRNMKAQRIVCSEFGTHKYPDPCSSLLDRFKSYFSQTDATDNCNVNVAFYGDQLYAMTETSFVHRVNPTNLETMNPKIALFDYMTINTATAHPHTLPDGTILNMGNNFRHKKGPHYCIIQVPPNYETDETSFKQSKIIAEIPCRWKFYPCYFHSFGMTTDKIIFIEQPYCLSVPKIMTSNFTGASFRDTLKWYPNEKTRMYVVSIKDGSTHPIIYETSELFTFHHANAYEENGQIVLDVAGYNSANFVNEIEAAKIARGEQLVLYGASLRRYVLPLEVSKVAKPGENLVTLPGTTAKAHLRSAGKGNGAVAGSEPAIDLEAEHFTEWFEFPRINYKYNGRKYNFLYGASATKEKREQSAFPDPDILIKYDIAKRKQLTWCRNDVLASEPVFIPKVPSPSSTAMESLAEDDGVILSALLHLDDEKKVSLLVLDAKDMKELALVEFQTEGSVPATFHGQWAGDAEKVHTY